MKLNYEDVQGVSLETFNSQAAELPSNSRKSTSEELREVEAILEVQPGTLASLSFHMGELNCEACDRQFSILDFVRSAITDAGHSTSLILHTFVGTKYILNAARFLRCSNCDTVSGTPVAYRCNNHYACGP